VNQLSRQQALRTQQHQQDNTGAKTDVPPLIGAAEKFRYQCEDDGSDQGPNRSLKSAQQRVQHGVGTEQDIEVLCFEIVEVVRIKRSGDSG